MHFSIVKEVEMTVKLYYLFSGFVELPYMHKKYLFEFTKSFLVQLDYLIIRITYLFNSITFCIDQIIC